MISFPKCVEQVNLGVVKNCSELLNATLSGATFQFEVKRSWTFNLEAGKNIFNLSEVKISEIGYMLMYSYESAGGRISLDSTLGNFPDFKVSLNANNNNNITLNGRLDESNKNCFSVLVYIEPAQKNFHIWIRKMYSYPGKFTIKTWLQDVGPYDINIIVQDGILINKSKYLRK